MKKIAILTIATGKYITLFNGLKDSIFEKFLLDYNKTIFLFTDNDTIINDNVKVIKIAHLPWPLNTLLRFHYFNLIKDELRDYDLIYYIDSDIVVYDIIDDEIIPINNEIIAPKHYWHENNEGTFEKSNSKSTAYVNCPTTGKYCQACFFGANASKFIEMCAILQNNIEIDLRNNVIAIWHDESHLNKYLLENPCKRLNIGYTHPSNYPIKLNKYPVKLLHKNANINGI